jgi:hypothetical protein
MRPRSIYLSFKQTAFYSGHTILTSDELNDLIDITVCISLTLNQPRSQGLDLEVRDPGNEVVWKAS